MKIRPPLDPARSHDQELSPDVGVRWWGPSKRLEFYWRSPARGDQIHSDGTPLLRVSAGLHRDEVKALRQFLDQFPEVEE